MARHRAKHARLASVVTTRSRNPAEPFLEPGQTRAGLGFWLYLMTDCLLFGSLFAAYMVLHGRTAGSVGSADIFSLPYVFAETLLLLTSSLICGLALLAAHAGKRRLVIMWLALTGVLGMAFIGMELHEFSGLVHEGHNWTHSAFLSAYFSLVGAHGLHIMAGLIWLGATLVYVYQRGLGSRLLERLTQFALFWHFLDIVWVGIFTMVYLVGVL